MTTDDSERLRLQTTPLQTIKGASGSLQTTSNDSDYGRLPLQTTLDDSEQLQTTPDDSRRLQTTPDDSGRLRTTPDNARRTCLPKSVPKLSESDRSRLRIFANFSHHLLVQLHCCKALSTRASLGYSKSTYYFSSSKNSP